jgi:hypothetical protein
MKCYLCSKSPPVGGTRYFVADAIGICDECGIGVCLKHGVRDETTKDRLLCKTCAEKLRKPNANRKTLAKI